MSADEAIGPSIPAPLTDDEDQYKVLRAILPHPDEAIITSALCKSCGQLVGTLRRVASTSCPLVWVGTQRSKDLIDYDVQRSAERGTKRRDMSSTSTYSTALGRPSTPAELPVRCDLDGDATISTSELLAAARSKPPRPTIRVRFGQR